MKAMLAVVAPFVISSAFIFHFPLALSVVFLGYFIFASENSRGPRGCLARSAGKMPAPHGFVRSSLWCILVSVGKFKMGILDNP